MNRLLIYDFDGVIADSEALANAVLAEFVTELGVPTTLQDAYTRYMGRRLSDVISEIENTTGNRLPVDAVAHLQSRTLDRFRKALRPVEGAMQFIETFAHVPKCIASSSSPDRLAVCLGLLDLKSRFGPHVYSAAQVQRGKPSPDLFLFAAGRMNIAPTRSVVLEDSPSGVEAGVSAGMTVIGLLAGTHIQDDHPERLKAAGAHHVVTTFAEAERVMHALLAEVL